MKNILKISFISLAGMLMQSPAYAYSKVIVKNPKKNEQVKTQERQEVSKEKQKPKKEKNNSHLSFSIIGRNVHLYNFDWGRLIVNGQPQADTANQNYALKNTKGDSYQMKNLSYALEYHKRIIPSIGFGVGVERLHIRRNALELKNLSGTKSVIGLFNELSPPVSDLNYYYDLDSFSSKSYNYLGFVRGYLAPHADIEPFIQFGIGLSHQKNTIHRKDGSVFSWVYDVPYVWQIGMGIGVPLLDGWAAEGYFGFRNEHSFGLKDFWRYNGSTPGNPTSAGFDLKAGRNRSLDLKLTLKKTW